MISAFAGWSRRQTTKRLWRSRLSVALDPDKHVLLALYIRASATILRRAQCVLVWTRLLVQGLAWHPQMYACWR